MSAESAARALVILKETHKPATASDTDKVNAVLTILNAANLAREETVFGDNPVHNLISVTELCTTTLDAIEWAIDAPHDSVPESPEVQGFNPAS